MAAKDESEDQITPAETYFNRRTFLRGGVLAASVATTGYAYRKLNGRSQATVDTRTIDGISAASDAADSGFRVDEPTTPFDSITHYNNFYEFSTNKDAVADRSRGFVTTGWQV